MSKSEHEEMVVLVDDAGNAIGTMGKSAVHHGETPLHAAFSIFLFNRRGEMLCQQRALHKKTWPGIWSNACCGHPAPGESTLAAAQRRLKEELDLGPIPLILALPTFRYRAEFLGIVENEICPVFIGSCEISPNPNPAEVADTRWVLWKDFADASTNPENSPFKDFSIWSLLEARALLQEPRFLTFLQGNCVV